MHTHMYVDTQSPPLTLAARLCHHAPDLCPSNLILMRLCSDAPVSKTWGLLERGYSVSYQLPSEPTAEQSH